jgi:hypothetical protein
MRRVQERRKKGTVPFLLKVPLLIMIVLLNIILLSWLGYVVHCLFTDAQVEKSLLEWADYLFIIFKRSIRPILDSL